MGADMAGGRTGGVRKWETMHDEYVSRGAVVAMVLWGIATALIVLVWVLAVSGAPLRYEGAVGVLAVGALTAAAVWQVRLYAVRLCALMRVASGIQGTDAEMFTITGKT